MEEKSPSTNSVEEKSNSKQNNPKQNSTVWRKVQCKSGGKEPLNKLFGHEQSFPSHPLPIFHQRPLNDEDDDDDNSDSDVPTQ